MATLLPYYIGINIVCRDLELISHYGGFIFSQSHQFVHTLYCIVRDADTLDSQPQEVQSLWVSREI